MQPKPTFPFKAFARYELNGKEHTHEAVIDAENGWHAMVMHQKLHLPSGAKVIIKSASKVLPKQ